MSKKILCKTCQELTPCRCHKMGNTIELGTVVTDYDKLGLRDAIHLPVLIAIAGDDLEPGQHVGFIHDEDSKLVGCAAKTIGIVDPFLSKWVKKGEYINIVIYPWLVKKFYHSWGI